jgi:hypothetical protein
MSSDGSKGTIAKKELKSSYKKIKFTLPREKLI